MFEGNLNIYIFKQFSLSKILDQIREYSDTTKRIFKATGIISFDNGFVELAYRELCACIFEEEIIKNRIAGSISEELHSYYDCYAEYEEGINSFYCDVTSLSQILEYYEEETKQVEDNIQKEFPGATIEEIVKPFAVLIQHISPKGPEIEVISRQIANAHTLFNITMTLIWVCLINVMVKIVMMLIPDGKAVDMNPAKPVFLDDKIISQPAAALQLVAKEILRVSEMVKVVVADTITIVKTEDLNELEPLQEKGVQIKKLTDQITEYLASLFSAGTMTEQQAAQTASLMYILSDVERMGTLSVEVAKCVREKVDNRYKYTPEAMDELQKSLKTLEKMFNDSLKALQGDESVQIEKLIKRKDKIMDLDLKMRKAHVQRVNKGKCKASLTAPFTNILHLIDRMGNSCVNLADVASNEISLNYFMVN